MWSIEAAVFDWVTMLGRKESIALTFRSEFIPLINWFLRSHKPDGDICKGSFLLLTMKTCYFRKYEGRNARKYFVFILSLPFSHAIQLLWACLKRQDHFFSILGQFIIHNFSIAQLTFLSEAPDLSSSRKPVLLRAFSWFSWSDIWMRNWFLKKTQTGYIFRAFISTLILCYFIMLYNLSSW